MNRIAIAAIIAASTAFPAVAAQWQEEQDKGIFLYTLHEGTARLEMVCDPEGLWTPPEFHVVATDGGQFLEGDTVEVKTADGSETFPLSGGSILGATPEVWNSLVEMLITPGTVTFSAGGKEVPFAIDSAIETNCTQEG